MTADPRTDPVGTVRQDDTGRIAVKTTTGSDTGGGHHVWCVTDENLEHRWLHHVEVARWRVLTSPLPDSVTEWGARLQGGSLVTGMKRNTADEFMKGCPSATLLRREVGPWTEVQP